MFSWYIDIADILALALDVQVLPVENLSVFLKQNDNGAHNHILHNDEILRTVLLRLHKHLQYPAQYYIITEYQTRYAVITLDPDLQSLLILGPYLDKTISTREIRDLTKSLHGTVFPGFADLKRYYDTVPVLAHSRVTSIVFRIERHVVGKRNLSIVIHLDYRTPAEETAPVEVPTLSQTIRLKYQILEQLTTALLQARIMDSANLAVQYIQLAQATTPSVNNAVQGNIHCMLLNSTLRDIVLQDPHVSVVKIEKLFTHWHTQIVKLSSQAYPTGISQQMTAEYAGLVKQKDLKPHSLPVLKALDYIAMHSLADVTLEQIADSAHVSVHYLSQLFSKEFGYPTLAYLNQQRLNYARILLDTTKLSVSEIVQKTGFNSSSYFSFRFKETFHMTPMQYRRREQ